MANSISDFKELKVWQAGMTLAQRCYFISKNFPKEEIFGLTSQVRRAATSVPANIAEGWGRESRGEFIHFLKIAQGSLKEVETHLLLSVNVGMLTSDKIDPALRQIEELSKMLRGLIRKLQEKNNP